MPLKGHCALPWQLWAYGSLFCFVLSKELLATCNMPHTHTLQISGRGRSGRCGALVHIFAVLCLLTWCNNSGAATRGSISFTDFCIISLGKSILCLFKAAAQAKQIQCEIQYAYDPLRSLDFTHRHIHAYTDSPL